MSSDLITPLDAPHFDHSHDDDDVETLDNTALSHYAVIRRNGQLTAFDANKIAMAMTKAFLEVEGYSATRSTRIKHTVKSLTEQVVQKLMAQVSTHQKIHIETIQDQVELALMAAGEHKVARAYVLYREQHAKIRAATAQKPLIHVKNARGEILPLDEPKIAQRVAQACRDLSDVDVDVIMQASFRNLYDGIAEEDINQVLIMAARTLIESEPNYSYVAARLLLDDLRRETFTQIHIGIAEEITADMMNEYYVDYFQAYIHYGIERELLDPRLAEYDLTQLAACIKPERDLQFTYLGLQTLYDRYFLHWDQVRFELPQAFFMRVAMGLALNESQREQRTLEFYDLLSHFDFMSSTPTLFNSGTLRPQLSSCFLTTIPDDLEGIFGAIRDNALLQKWAGGLGNDWTPVRGMGSLIKGTNGQSQGIVPFMKVANDTLIAVNQGGKRKGSGCAYLETWHIDIEEFLELRKNTGDERRRTHDMNTANWIPDLFMERVHLDQEWTLFSPHEVPDLHERYGDDFKIAYTQYEQMAAEGKIRLSKKVSAVGLWRKMLTMLFETGHPWITFKDPCNIRNPQQHVGVVHSSNLCTEITLNTKANEEIAVCNLGSINLVAHINEQGQLDEEKLARTVQIAMRMLDNVIDINYYSVSTAQTANLRHRPVGLGLMGFQDALYRLRLPYASEAAIEFADYSMEFISYQAIYTSTLLAEERGCYSTFKGSLWSQGILPIDSLQLLAQSRGHYLSLSLAQRLDWNGLRERVKTVGMRNSNCMAIAPTATISNICGVSQSIEPAFQNLFVKSNLSGEFTVINSWLVADLKKLGIWDDVMVNDLKYFDGHLASIARIPDDMKRLYQTAFEIESSYLIEAAARRQKWLDQAQSLNLYMAQPAGRKLDSLYKLAWIRGLKTTYYLRTLGATHVEKSTVNLPNYQQPMETLMSPNSCNLDGGECEACQ
ncbi:ribonucleoside-diphosphate reductase subunit alpha [Thioflexithrix psekupsensis]|uniref:Ribonucleoside-diphosphate reductase n=1 Tax=Thioflexithrix psekupsensis TaxID=1570016 RepID=A0A251X4L1_9GAMM|nr:ribonucleoside-diphosphate reductase subunit alpha [Thioflexithrix psekupsensis]OUD12361.1 ribonucleoside-diphosphate reductase subunit alpha [Thioflexithrix psekupsensis]